MNAPRTSPPFAAASPPSSASLGAASPAPSPDTLPLSRHRGALVLFSGGQDSTTCVAWALRRYARVETVGFDYGQRHRIELEQRPVVLERLAALDPDAAGRLGADHLLDVQLLGRISDTALTSERAIGMTAGGLPNTFVPARNLVFLTLAAALAWRRGLDVLVAGVCETDYSGYPDCRDDTIKAQQVALSLGLDARMTIETPLMWLDKADTWALAERLGGAALVRLIVEDTHTCYLGERGEAHDWGHGCGHCPACALRARGWAEYRRRHAPADNAPGGLPSGPRHSPLPPTDIP